MQFEAEPEMQLLWGEAVIFTDSHVPLAASDFSRIWLVPCNRVQTRAQGQGRQAIPRELGAHKGQAKVNSLMMRPK